MHLNPFTAAHPAGPLALAHVNPLLGAGAFARGALVPGVASPLLGDGRPGPFAPRAFGAPALGDASDRVAGQVFGGRGGAVLVPTGVVPGTYTSVTVDLYGRVVAGTSPSGAIDITGLTAADPADDDEVPVYDTSATANRKVTIQKVLGLCAATPGGRLSTANTDAFEINGGSNTIYYLPVYHARLPLWDGTRWLNLSYSDSGLSIALSGLTANRPYDVFCYSSGGSPTLELLAWTSDTARATGISIQDGRYCKTGDKTRLYLGSIYTNATNSVNQSIGEEPLWNMYHRRERELYAIETANSWTYATNTWRQWNNSSNSRVKFVIGLKAEVVKVTAVGNMNLPTGAGGAVGIGYDSTTANVATGIGQAYCSGTSALDSHAVESSYATHSSVGSHYFQMLEIARAGTVTFLGDGGTPATTQSKIKAYLWS